jgi:Eco57I restriction-modification methylase
MAVKAFSGSLVSRDLLEGLGERGIAGTSALRAALGFAAGRLGPASGARQIFDLLAAPVVVQCGGAIAIVESMPAAVSAIVTADGRPAATLATTGWNGDLRRLRHATAGRLGPRWWIGTNGLTIRILDATRAYAQRAVDIDVETLAIEDAAIEALTQLLDLRTAGAFHVLAELVGRSEAHRADVGRSLQTGVETALTGLIGGFAGSRKGANLDAALADALTVVYRILFLLFAEARGLVPQWHPIYRDSYTIESLRPIVEGRRRPAGVWQSLQAIARLAHRGCTAGSLRVVPFNGRLFAPAAAPLAESMPLDDRVIADVLLAVTTRPLADRRERISYADLGVEQLGSVYERVLEYVPARDGDRIAMSPSGRRKRTGTFYTPRAMTEYLVRRTLAPLVHGAAPGRILALRVLDPSMGSGAFLVAACRYLASAYEAALIAEGTVTRADLSPADRAAFRRTIAQRCLYGVDANPTAVQLARLSLWLCTLAADRPLTFLDHRLRAGNSLAGASMADVMLRPPGPRPPKRRRGAPQPWLFDEGGFASGLSAAVGVRTAVAVEADDSAAAVRRKERAIERLEGEHGPLRVWRALADGWCAAWFWPRDAAPLPATAWLAFSAALRGGDSGLPASVEDAWRRTSAAVAASTHFFHWDLEFPEVFHDDRGAPRADAGFDAVIGNPPWAAAGSLTRFSRDSGCYRLQGDGHANLYQLFAERMLALAAAGGRVGMLMPSGLLTDAGCADLRRHLFDGCDVDAVASFDNGEGLFPIHRGVRFALVTATTGRPTGDVCLRAGLRDAAALDDLPDRGAPPGCVRVPMGMLRAFGGDGRPVPDLRSELDRAVLGRLLAAGPPLESRDGWHIHFGRELNATDDRPHFGRAGLPVLEGKQLEPFRVRVEDASCFINRAIAERLLHRRTAIDRPRLGYREVASATNRLTLIAAIVPAGVVTTHTIFCVREPLDEEAQWFLCGVFNSYAANYCVRLRGGTHVPAAVIQRLPVPYDLPPTVVKSIAAGARELATTPHASHAARLQAGVARVYGLTRAEFAHVLSTFPLVAPPERDRALQAFDGSGI